jgi:hypothetical protein
MRLTTKLLFCFLTCWVFILQPAFTSISPLPHQATHNSSLSLINQLPSISVETSNVLDVHLHLLSTISLPSSSSLINHLVLPISTLHKQCIPPSCHQLLFEHCSPAPAARQPACTKYVNLICCANKYERWRFNCRPPNYLEPLCQTRYLSA